MVTTRKVYKGKIFTQNMEGIDTIKRTIGKNSKVTLVDRLKNTSKNIHANPFTFIYPLVTATLLYATISLGIKSHNLGKTNKGYANAYAQVQNITGILNSNTNFWQNTPMNKIVFEPVKDSVALSLSRKESKEGQEVKGLVQKVEESIYSLQSGGTNSPSREALMKQLHDKLKPLSETSEKHGLGALILGVFAILGGIFSFETFNKTYFQDHNSDKKELNRRYHGFLKKTEDALADKTLDEEGITYLGNFFNKMDFSNPNYRDLGIILTVLGQNLEQKSKQLLKVLSEHPSYDRNTLESLTYQYHLLRRQDKDDQNNPARESKLKSKKDLLLDIWSRKGNKESANIQQVVETIESSLTYEEEVPEILDALISGTRSLSEIREALEFMSSGIITKEEVARKLVQYYLQTPERQPLSHDLSLFGNYVNNRIENLNPAEALTLLSELESLKNCNNSRHYNIPYTYDWPTLPECEEVVDIARNTFKQNRLLASKVLSDVNKIARETPLIRKMYGEIFSKGFVPTPYLIEKLRKAKNARSELEKWEETRKEITQGNFDPLNKLKRNLEYTHYYCEAIKLEKDADFDSYEAVLGGNQNG